MSTIVLEASIRTDMGKGASRRLRRLEEKVPAIIYGGDKAPEPVYFLHRKISKALENESIYSSIFEVNVDGKKEKVILKALQRHPYRPIIMHMDLQRVGTKDVLVKQVPIHFINEDICKGVKAGGMITHNATQVEVRCQATQLPEYIEVDMANVDINDVIHLSSLSLPKGVKLATELTDKSHDLPVVSIHTNKSAEPASAEPEAEPEENA